MVSHLSVFCQHLGVCTNFGVCLAHSGVEVNIQQCQHNPTHFSLHGYATTEVCRHVHIQECMKEDKQAIRNKEALKQQFCSESYKTCIA